MSAQFLLIFSYFAIAIVVIGTIFRGLKIAKMPVHLRWELAPVPHEKGKAKYGGSFFEEYEWWTKPREKSIVNELWYMFQEIVFLKGVWEHNRKLWFFSFPFHFGGLYLLGGLVGLVAAGAIMQIAGIECSVICPLISLCATVGYVLGGVGVLGLLARRLTDSEIKPFTTPAAIFNLLFLLAIFASGLLALARLEYFAQHLVGFMKGFLTANGAFMVPRSLSLHIIISLLFLIYLPFTYMMHFVAKYFTYHEVRWNDTPMEAGSPMAEQVGGLLGQKVTWSAPHIKGEGKKTWVDVATEEVKK